MFTLIPFVSYFLIVYSLDRIDLNFKLSENIIIKGNTFLLNIEINATRFKPLPFLYIETFSGNRIKTTEDTNYLLCLFNETNIKLDIKYEAIIWGEDSVGIKNIYVYDFFKLFKFTITPPKPKKINIAPNIQDINYENLVSCIIINSNSDNEDNTIPFGLISNLSYEHREYVIGDSLKKINWKLSSKTKKLFVRQNEYYENNNINIILDKKSCLQNKDNRLNFICEEKIIESLLSFIDSLLKEHISCCLSFSNNDFFNEFEIKSNDDLNQIQEIFSKYSFNDTSIRLPVLKEDSIIVLFTCSMDNNIVDYESNLKNLNNTCFVIASDKNNYHSLDGWYIDENYELIQNLEV